MRAVCRFKEGRKLLQSSYQPTADVLLAERLISSSLAGPSNASSVSQVAKRISNAQSNNAIAGLGRLYSSLTRAGASGPAAAGPKQQVGFDLRSCYLRLLVTVWLVHSPFAVCKNGIQTCCRQLLHSNDHCDDSLAANHHVKVQLVRQVVWHK